MNQSSSQSSDHVGSEVATFRKQIALQEEAANRALSNGAAVSRHDTISHNTHKDLCRWVGPDQAIQVCMNLFGWTAEDIAAGSDPKLAPEEATNAESSS
jgi:hypothetical protein